MATVVTIGRNVSDIDGNSTPMEAGAWADFRYFVEQELRFRTGEVYFSGTGRGNSDQWGREEAHCVVAAELGFGQDWQLLLEVLQVAALAFKQEAIAVQSFWTGGETDFVKAVGT